MRFDDSADAAAALLKRAVPEMVKRGIPTDPVNYALWYTFVAQRDEKLNRELVEQFPGKGSYTPEKGEELFFEHIVKPRIPEHQLSQEQTLRVLSELLERVLESSAGAEEYQRSLEKGIETLQGNADQQVIEETLQSLLGETIKAQEVNSAFQARLDASQKEIEALKDQLAKSEREALHDPLTGVGNRRRFDQALESATREAASVSLLLVDIDHFKRINDTYGHAVGDLVLQRMGRILLGYECEQVAVARYGGEEFGAVLRDHTREEVREIAEGIRRHVAEMHLADSGSDHGKTGPISASVGMAVRQSGESAESLFKRADAALYEAKHGGRNQVRIAV